MKINKIISAITISLLLFTSCNDMIMEWYKDPNKGEVAMAELPLPLAEKIERYDVLKSYTNFNLGIGIDLTMYLENETYRNIVNANFDEVVLGYHMKHGAMVSSTGAINYAKVDEFVQKIKEAGLTLYGHTLVWHQNQNASYLNGLIAPTILPDAAGTNALDISGLKDGSFTGWSKSNPGAGITVEDGKGLSATSKAVVLKSSASSANAWSLQLGTPAITVVADHTYEVSFYIKSDSPGKGRISFVDLKNNYPWMDWYATGGSMTEAFQTTSTWQQVKFTLNANDDAFNASTFKMNFDLGYLPDVTYYIDVENIKVIDKDAAPVVVNMLANGTFDTDLTGWAKWNGTGDFAHVTGSDAFQGGGAMKVVNPTSNSGGQWKTQIHADFAQTLVAGTYTVSFYIRSDVAGSVRCSTTGTAHYQGDQTTAITWKQVSWDVAMDGTETGLNFDLGLVAATYYIDNVVVTPKSAAGIKRRASKVTIIEKTDAEKAKLIGDAMTAWISGVMTHYKNDVKAWDVVNEPMKENGTLRDGIVEEPASDEFYWVKYLGKDFAVTAFKLARQYGNATDKLFINDYNLEYSLEKCDGLIDYVKYIESKGATVDGIGTQMHISISSDTTKIKQMFQKLAASGKLIKVSELDIKVNTKTPSLSDYEKQAVMYKFVVDAFMKYIPETQRYGIVVWSVSDAVEEHENWIPDDGPCLWDKDYARKHAYKGFADGLAGKDVSVDFSGELQY